MYTLLTVVHDHECRGGKECENQDFVSLLTGVHLTPKKVAYNRNMYQNACIGGAYMSEPK